MPQNASRQTINRDKLTCYAPDPQLLAGCPGETALIRANNKTELIYLMPAAIDVPASQIQAGTGSGKISFDEPGLKIGAVWTIIPAVNLDGNVA